MIKFNGLSFNKCFELKVFSKEWRALIRNFLSEGSVAIKVNDDIPQEFDIKPRVTLVGEILLLHHSAIRVPMNWHTCLVSSRARCNASTF
jgi:hypothetical protein